MNILIFAILIFQYVMVNCVVPDLSVRRLDKTTIAKKRQDTLDMCRIFNEEKASNVFTPEQAPYIVKSYGYRKNNRVKRNALKYAVNPALKLEDEKRVEEIVDKLYDDLSEKEKKVKRKGKKHRSKKASRRFDFAPNLLVGPHPPEIQPKPLEGPDIPSKARWKNGIVPYFIDPKTYDAQLAETIMKAFDYVEKATCIRLQKLREKPVDTKSLRDVDWVYITNPFGIRQCVHSNENRKLDGVQMAVFGYDCMSTGDIVHEVMHILGYSHEHLRSDRDQFISVLWDNIKPGYKKYFDISNGQNTLYTLENLPYDYTSIMHYPPRAFSKNGQVTLLAESGISIGQRQGLSELDVEKVGLIYSLECVNRNKQYLLKTCPSVVKADIKPANVTQEAINDYFKDRLWDFGIINYKFRDNMEFTPDERENMLAVFRHIEKETCLRFKDVGAPEEQDIDDEDDDEADYDEDEQKPKSVEKVDSNNDLDAKKTNNESENEVNLSEDNDPKPNFVVEPYTDAKKTNNDSENEVDLSDDNNPKPNFVVEPYTDAPKGRMGPSAKRVKRNIDFMKEVKKVKKTSGKIVSRVKNTLKHIGTLRRHASHVIVLARSAEPGCKCPEAGKPEGNNVLEVHADCFNSVNDLLHFFVHVLGLDHQHNMHDRDSYLHIVWENLTPEIKEEMSKKLPPPASVGFPYDYQSVMHYPWLEIKNGVTNIMYPIWNDGWSMGHWQGLSATDVQKLNLLYFDQCSERYKQEHHD